MNSRTLPPGSDLQECAGRAQGLVGLQCVFVCCMSWKTQISKVLISERTWGPCSWSLEVSLDSPLSQVSGETVSTTSLWEHLTEDMSPLVPRSVASPPPSPFPDAPILPSERNSLDSEPAPAPWHGWQTRPEVQVQPELLQMSTECSQDHHTPVSVHLCVHCKLGQQQTRGHGERTPESLARQTYTATLKCMGT